MNFRRKATNAKKKKKSKERGLTGGDGSGNINKLSQRGRESGGRGAEKRRKKVLDKQREMR